MGKGLPKKYAKMGFKKGWKAYKKTKGKRKSSPKRKTKTKKKGGYVARRRRYTRRRSSRSKNINIPIGGIAIGLSAMYQLGAFDAAELALAGDIKGAGMRLGQNSVADVVAASIPIAVYGMAKKVIGQQTLFKFGKVHIKL